MHVPAAPLHRGSENQKVTKTALSHHNAIPRARRCAGNNMAELQSRIFTDAATGLALPYRLFVPASCSSQDPCGLLLFLHGAGERGNDNQSQLKNDALAWTTAEAQAGHPTIVVYPQCPSGMQWVDAPWVDGSYSVAKTATSEPMTAVMALLASRRSKGASAPANRSRGAAAVSWNNEFRRLALTIARPRRAIWRAPTCRRGLMGPGSPRQPAGRQTAWSPAPRHRLGHRLGEISSNDCRCRGSEGSCTACRSVHVSRQGCRHPPGVARPPSGVPSDRRPA